MAAGPPDDHGVDDRTTVVAFDFDGTLTNGGSVLPFLVAVRGLGPVVLAVARTSPHLLHGALVSGRVADDAKELLFRRLLAGLPADTLERQSLEFAHRHLRRRLRPDVSARLDWHRKQGHRVVVVSASPECYVAPAAELLGADAALGTRLAVGGGNLLTGGYEGKNCRGTEKYARLTAWLRAEGLTTNGSEQPVLWAYGNSRGDRRLLEAADVGVNAGRLGRWGRLHRFRRLADLPPLDS
jgi:HAD superfamily hydrolase (TIGR01490 family)